MKDLNQGSIAEFCVWNNYLGLYPTIDFYTEHDIDFNGCLACRSMTHYGV